MALVPWETVIGLEIHVQLASQSKIFSGSSTAFGAEPNTQANVIDLGLPGVLPVLNQQAVRMAIMFGLATQSTIATPSIFARKNYFYPDLPKGYQISQYELPIVHSGQLRIDLEDGSSKIIAITRAHLEEDAGKSLHEDFHGMSGIDLNRAGTPLLEIVSEPELSSAAEAVAYMKKIHALVRYLGICDGNMQEGSFRCDANVSVRKMGENKLGTRAEIKNLNSFRFVERAINFEIERQIDIIEAGGEVIQETRLYDDGKDETRSMRSKEEANDYRYFPDPDLLPVVLDQDFIAAIKQQLPELPDAKRERFIEQYQLSDYVANILTSSRELADYFEALVAKVGAEEAKLCANWVMGELAAALNKSDLDITASRLTAQQLAGLLKRIQDGTISGKIAKEVFEVMWETAASVTTATITADNIADNIIQQRGLKQVSDSQAIAAVIDEIIAANPKQLEQYRAGKQKLKGFFVGQVMKAFKGQANPQQVNELLEQKLNDNTSTSTST